MSIITNLVVFVLFILSNYMSSRFKFYILLCGTISELKCCLLQFALHGVHVFLMYLFKYIGVYHDFMAV
jgi:hypothetical protein